ncbi:hypothetical protein [Tolypothrix sp. VBCCA 56010]|uniref:hypothetical protein n=1 Tax=Tolypothrix sp. VBCCA 56010 TaxID=3137731 RepID=UPI003D7D1D58
MGNGHGAWKESYLFTEKAHHRTCLIPNARPMPHSQCPMPHYPTMTRMRINVTFSIS